MFTSTFEAPLFPLTYCCNMSIPLAFVTPKRWRYISSNRKAHTPYFHSSWKHRAPKLQKNRHTVHSLPIYCFLQSLCSTHFTPHNTLCDPFQIFIYRNPCSYSSCNFILSQNPSFTYRLLANTFHHQRFFLLNLCYTYY